MIDKIQAEVRLRKRLMVLLKSPHYTWEHQDHVVTVSFLLKSGWKLTKEGERVKKIFGYNSWQSMASFQLPNNRHCLVRKALELTIAGKIPTSFNG